MQAVSEAPATQHVALQSIPATTDDEPYHVSITSSGLGVVANLKNADDIEALIRVLKAGKMLIQPTTAAFSTSKDDQPKGFTPDPSINPMDD